MVWWSERKRSTRRAAMELMGESRSKRVKTDFDEACDGFYWIAECERAIVV